MGAPLNGRVLPTLSAAPPPLPCFPEACSFCSLMLPPLEAWGAPGVRFWAPVS